jgi:zinc protease
MPIAVSSASLANGLRVIVQPDSSSSVTAVTLWYGVGSRHERSDEHGSAHLIEHLLFEGSARIAPGEHLGLLQSVGATNVSAATSWDRTRCFQTVPQTHLELALWLEAERMESVGASLNPQKVARQREIVLSERRQRYDGPPYASWFEAVFELVFPLGHPYRHPAMGTPTEIAAATAESLGAFWERNYGPGNAIVSVAGAARPDQVFAAASRFFGPLRGPASDAAERSPAMDVAPTLGGEVRRTIQAVVPAPRVIVAHRIPPFGTTEWDVAHVLAAMLGSGRGSMLYRLLVRTGIAQPAEAFTSAWDFRYGCSMLVSGLTADRGVRVDRVEQALHEVVDLLACAGTRPTDLRRAQAIVRARWLRRMAKAAGRADAAAQYALLFGSADHAGTQLERWQSVSGRDVAEFAARWLTPDNRAVLTYLPASVPADADAVVS